MLEWVAYPFSSGSSRPRYWTGVSCMLADSSPTELSGRPSVLLILGLFFCCGRLWIIGKIWRMVRLQSGDCQELWSWSGSSEPWREWPWDLGQWACPCSLVWLKTEAHVFCRTRRHVLSCVKHLRFLQNPEVREAFSPHTCDFLTAR